MSVSLTVRANVVKQRLPTTSQAENPDGEKVVANPEGEVCAPRRSLFLQVFTQFHDFKFAERVGPDIADILKNATGAFSMPARCAVGGG